MKKFSILIIIIMIGYSTFGQKESKLTNYYYDINPGNQFGVSISGKNVISKYNFAKLGFQITNNTDDFILFYKDKCKNM